ncbi:hypothetical protein [Xanthomonas sp. 1678]|uniref:hypothetical protein n=1 Tax=Xanthomonas sp. 1678 TaxID=3158788 RepID=UPI0028663C7C|nr:hypothetical protein [Xanthomonas translucens]
MPLTIAMLCALFCAAIAPLLLPWRKPTLVLWLAVWFSSWFVFFYLLHGESSHHTKHNASLLSGIFLVVFTCSSIARILIHWAALWSRRHHVHGISDQQIGS